MLFALIAAQITLGALTVLSGKQYIVNSLHVVTGAAVLGTSLVLTLRAVRPRFEEIRSPGVGILSPAGPISDSRAVPEPVKGGALVGPALPLTGWQYLLGALRARGPRA